MSWRSCSHCRSSCMIDSQNVFYMSVDSCERPRSDADSSFTSAVVFPRFQQLSSVYARLSILYVCAAADCYFSCRSGTFGCKIFLSVVSLLWRRVCGTAVDGVVVSLSREREEYDALRVWYGGIQCTQELTGTDWLSLKTKTNKNS